jgi:hypothetical protein
MDTSLILLATLAQLVELDALSAQPTLPTAKVAHSVMFSIQLPVHAKPAQLLTSHLATAPLEPSTILLRLAALAQLDASPAPMVLSAQPAEMHTSPQATPALPVLLDARHAEVPLHAPPALTITTSITELARLLSPPTALLLSQSASARPALSDSTTAKPLEDAPTAAQLPTARLAHQTETHLPAPSVPLDTLYTEPSVLTAQSRAALLAQLTILATCVLLDTIITPLPQLLSNASLAKLDAHSAVTQLHALEDHA